MSPEVQPTNGQPEPQEPKSRRRRKRGSIAGISMLAQGEPMIWLTGGALALCLLMIVGLLGAVLYLGMSTFRPLPIVQVELLDGSIVAGEITKEESYNLSADSLLNEQPMVVDAFIERTAKQLGGDQVVADLPNSLEDTSRRIREDIEEAKEKVAQLEELISRGEKDVEERIASLEGGNGRIQDRLDAILASADGKKLKRFRSEVQTIRGKQQSLESQLEGNKEAIEYLAKPPATEVPESEASSPEADVSPELKQIFQTPRQVKVAILNALLTRLAAEQGEKHVRGTRRLFRIGNKKITGKTFQWVADYEIKPESQETPEWSVVVERTEWGRFYGTPKQFILRHRRLISSEETELANIVKLFDDNLHRAELEEAQQEALKKAIDPLRNELASIRQKSMDSFFADFGTEENKQLLAVPELGEAVAIGERTDGTNYIEAFEVWSTPEAAWSKFEEFHGEILERSADRHELKKHDLGLISRKRNDAAKKLRKEELKLDKQLAPIYRKKKAVDEQLSALREQGVDPSSDEWKAAEQRQQDLLDEAREIEEKTINLVSLCSEVYQYRNRVKIIDDLISANNALLAAASKRLGKDSAATTAAAKIVASLNADKKTERRQPAETLANLEAELGGASDEVKATVDEYFAVQQQSDTADAAIQADIKRITAENNRYELLMSTATGNDTTLSLDTIVRAYPANQLTTTDKAAIYGSRWWEFVAEDPREANSEGGVLPAIWGTVVMTLIMSIAVAPFGVLAALYLREYAKAGMVVSTIRISISNLAGVPSIVFGVFGLGFFCYGMGGYIDGGPENASWPVLPSGKWYVVLGLLAVVSTSAFVFSLFGAAKPGATATKGQRTLSVASTVCWIAAAGVLAAILITTPYFRGFYEADLPNPTFGKGGVLWASLTLALLTLPVVIVATEEALAAVPNSMREGSYGCGASKWQTIRNIVLPHALPGIMTGMILAMARGAGEVAPLMLVGAVKLAPELPLQFSDWSGSIGPLLTGPLHSDRSFMHLGFHIYDLGFQSQDSEAAKPMVFTTTLLLILIIAALNIGAIWLRARLRRRFQAGQF